MGLITKPKVPSFEEHEPLSVQDPLIHSENFCQEAADEIADEQAFQRTLAETLRPVVERNRAVEKRQAEKAVFWLRKMKAGASTDWDRLVEDVRRHDANSARFLEQLVARAREQGLI